MYQANFNSALFNYLSVLSLFLYVVRGGQFQLGKNAQDSSSRLHKFKWPAAYANKAYGNCAASTSLNAINTKITSHKSLAGTFKNIVSICFGIKSHAVFYLPSVQRTAVITTRYNGILNITKLVNYSLGFFRFLLDRWFFSINFPRSNFFPCEISNISYISQMPRCSPSKFLLFHNKERKGRI